MATNIPTNTYDSTTNLSLGNIPQVDDEQVYQALLDIHNAIEILLTSSDGDTSVFDAYIDKRRKIVVHTADYTITTTDGTILVNANLNPVTITLPPAASGTGFRYKIKAIDVTFPVLLIANGSETIDLATDGWNFNLLDEIPVISDGSNWWIE